MKLNSTLTFLSVLLASSSVYANEALTMNGPIQVTSSNGDYSAKLGGDIQWDLNHTEFNGSEVEDGFTLRRGRISLSGKVKDWSYGMLYNMGTNDYEVFVINYNGWGKEAVITIGNQPEPFALEQIESPKNYAFLERSAIVEKYSTFLDKGILLSGDLGNTTYAIGLFENDYIDENLVGKNGYALTGRLTYAPIMTDTQTLHLGLAHSERGGDLNTTGVELSYTYKSLHMKSEFMSSDDNGLSESGYYVEAGWVLTGEVRPYSNGVFGRIKPRASSGAWQLVTRYENGDGNFADVELGYVDATSYGFGVNYYATENIRIGLNYTDATDVFDNEGSEIKVRLQLAL